MPKTYPTTFRLPEWTPLAMNFDAGLLRTEFAAGNSRQRRRYTVEPVQIEATIVMKRNEWGKWHRWWMLNAFDWFLMPLASPYASELGKNCDPTLVRCMSDVAIPNFYTFDVLEIKVTLEALFDPATAGLGPDAPSDIWIIAGRPVSPALSKVYVAGTPAAPAADTVLSGTPARPSASV